MPIVRQELTLTLTLALTLTLPLTLPLTSASNSNSDLCSCVVGQVLSEAQLEELTRDDPLLRAFAARDPNAPTTALRRAEEGEEIPADA